MPRLSKSPRKGLASRTASERGSGGARKGLLGSGFPGPKKCRICRLFRAEPRPVERGTARTGNLFETEAAPRGTSRPDPGPTFEPCRGVRLIVADRLYPLCTAWEE